MHVDLLSIEANSNNNLDAFVCLLIKSYRIPILGEFSVGKESELDVHNGTYLSPHWSGYGILKQERSVSSSGSLTIYNLKFDSRRWLITVFKSRSRLDFLQSHTFQV
jgi:hypothetical protein